MENNDDSFTMDNSAQQLYKQFAGLDNTSRNIESATASSALMQLLNQEEKLLDYYRLLLAQATAQFVGILANSRFAILAKENEQKVKVLAGTLKRIAKFPKFDGKIYCRLRGQQCPSGKIGSETYDYELSFGNFLLDFQVAQTVAEREKANGAAIYTKLMEAFNALSAMNIFNFCLDIGTGGAEEHQRLDDALHHLMRFYADEKSPDRLVVNDEHGRPSINLTLLAATNNLSAATLQGLVDKIGAKLLSATPAEELNLFTTAYDVIFASKRNRELLKKLPIEINNVQWLMQKLQNNRQQTSQAVQVSRFIMAKYGSNPRMASEVISSITSGGYADIRTEVMGKRLTCASEFLNLTEASTNPQTLQNEALQNIEEGLDRIPDAVYNKITIQNGEVSTESAEGQKTKWSFHEKILGLLSFFKQRSTTKEKVRNIANRLVLFDSEDHAVIARNFRVSEKDAEKLLDLLRGCFDDTGHFRRNFFEKNIPEFVRYDSRVFEFLWHYLKELPLRNDRVAFLNALHILVARLKQPQEALAILLADVFNKAAVINYSDRNGLILGNMLLHPSILSGGSNIERTPNEVMLVRKKLNQAMVAEALKYCEESPENIIQKVRRITEALLLKSSSPDHDEVGMQPRFLLYLQRELVIFLTLIGGEFALAIVQGVVQEFGNPDSEYYKEMRKKENLRPTLQLLQIATQGLRRFENAQAIAMIDTVLCREKEFVNLWAEPTHQAYVKTVMERISKPD
ncbi:MAG: hypothetical protein HGA96_12905 [Desulfobulbaceae bacterium]|nr:hypothetical protein [Desulfobulbaceae bacterium]